VGQTIIQLSREEGLDPITQFNLATSVCLSKARTWISNAIYQSWSFFVFSKLRCEVIVCFVDIGRIVDHHFSAETLSSCVSA